MKRQALLSPTLKIRRCLLIFTSGISSPFSELSPTLRQITHVLRTLAPLQLTCIATGKLALDLHVLSTPPAFVLSQNQTLRIFKTLSLTQLVNHRIRTSPRASSSVEMQFEGRLFNFNF